MSKIWNVKILILSIILLISAVVITAMFLNTDSPDKSTSPGNSDKDPDNGNGNGHGNYLFDNDYIIEIKRDFGNDTEKIMIENVERFDFKSVIRDNDIEVFFINGSMINFYQGLVEKTENSSENGIHTMRYSAKVQTLNNFVFHVNQTINCNPKINNLSSSRYVDTIIYFKNSSYYFKNTNTIDEDISSNGILEFSNCYLVEMELFRDFSLSPTGGTGSRTNQFAILGVDGNIELILIQYGEWDD